MTYNALVSFDSPVYCLLCVAAVFGLAATPLFRAADTAPNPQPQRVLTLDGLRGFLALAVVLHHVDVYHGWLVNLEWATPASRFYEVLGPVGVALFFMITGYLFWGRALAQRGRMRAVPFFVGRVFRIVPLYLVAVAGMLLAVFASTHFQLRVPAIKAFHSCVPWLLGGVFFGGDVNNFYRTSLLLAGVTWTVRDEWYFYFLLPILALLARHRALGAALPVAGVVLGALFSTTRPALTGPVLMFSCGMLSASLASYHVKVSWRQGISSAVAVALLVLAFVFWRNNSQIHLLFLAPFFFLVSQGCSLFGLLLSTPARRLGDISYGIYLLQGLVLATIFRSGVTARFASSSPVAFWLCGLAAVVLLALVAMASHVWVERTGIDAGKRLIRRLPSRWTRPATPIARTN